MDDSAARALADCLSKAREQLLARGVTPPFIVNLHPSWDDEVNLKNFGKVIERTDSVIRLRVR